MHAVRLASETDFDGWRRAARGLAVTGVPPDRIVWTVGAPDLLGLDQVPTAKASGTLAVPAAFVALASTAILHSDPERFALLYTLLWRLRAERALLDVSIDPLVARIERMAKAIRRDIHKMHAFVRFREIQDGQTSHHVAWFEPDHHIVAAAAPFFQRRFASMRWSILTPEQSAHWDGIDLTIGAGAPEPPAQADGSEDLWLTYYASIFNPARLKVAAMRAEMPRKYWKNLPEAVLIQPLIATASARSHAMIEAAPPLPNARPQRQERAMTGPDTTEPAHTLAALRREAAACRACPLWKPATQTVFGEGPQDARIVLVGEQPGDNEDLAGKPFIGPAGELLDRALKEAGIDRGKVYVTNAVKHFKFTLRGKRRLHQRPNGGEIQACRFWLSSELELIRPRLVVALGATALHSLAGKALPIGTNRGKVVTLGGMDVLPTVHPSYLLRLPDPEARAAEYIRFVADLRMAARQG